MSYQQLLPCVFPSVPPAGSRQHAAGGGWNLDMMEAREGGLSRPGEVDEQHHKDKVMERDTGGRRGEERGGEGSARQLFTMQLAGCGRGL